MRVHPSSDTGVVRLFLAPAPLLLLLNLLNACAAEVRVDGPDGPARERVVDDDTRMIVNATRYFARAVYVSPPLDEPPVDEVPIEEAPVEAPVEEVPVEEVPVEEVPVEEAPVEDVPVEEVPVEEPPVEDPVDEGPLTPPPPPPDPDDHGSLVPGTQLHVTFVVPPDNVWRQGYIIVPTALANGKLPLVIVFHANGETHESFVTSLGLDTLAEERGFILLALRGIPRVLPEISTTAVAWDAYTAVDANDDLQLINHAVPEMLETRSILADRVTLLGYSQGGFMAFRAAMESSTSFAAAAVVSAASPIGNGVVTNATHDLPMKMRIGANDPLVSAARASRDALIAAGHVVEYEEIAGLGHYPFPGSPAPVIDWLLAQ